MALLDLHRVSTIRARFNCSGPDNNWVCLTFPGRNADFEITLFFYGDAEQARAYADAINSVPVMSKRPRDMPADPIDFADISLEELESQSAEYQLAYWEWMRLQWLTPQQPDTNKPDDEAA